MKIEGMSRWMPPPTGKGFRPGSLGTPSAVSIVYTLSESIETQNDSGWMWSKERMEIKTMHLVNREHTLGESFKQWIITDEGEVKWDKIVLEGDGMKDIMEVAKDLRAS